VDIGVDIDNILVNTTECVLEWLAERGAPKKTIQDITIYYLENNYFCSTNKNRLYKHKLKINRTNNTQILLV
jgi:uncharacterized pyridoxamine 5'-phosphate oxidase family protein